MWSAACLFQKVTPSGGDIEKTGIAPGSFLCLWRLHGLCAVRWFCLSSWMVWIYPSAILRQDRHQEPLNTIPLGYGFTDILIFSASWEHRTKPPLGTLILPIPLPLLSSWWKLADLGINHTHDFTVHLPLLSSKRFTEAYQANSIVPVLPWRFLATSTKNCCGAVGSRLISRCPYSGRCKSNTPSASCSIAPEDRSCDNLGILSPPGVLADSRFN